MKRLLVMVGLAGLLPALTACGAFSADASGKPDIVAAFYPYAFVAQRIAGNHATVTNLTSPGLEPHDLELTPRQVADLSVADLVTAWTGPTSSCAG